LLATRSYDPSGALSREVTYSYDDEGRLVAEQLITQDGKVNSPATYVYDSDGRKVKIRQFDSYEQANMMIGIEGTISIINSAEVKRIETRYDDRDEAVDVSIFNAAGSLVSRIEITRDTQGNLLEETQFTGDVAPFGQCASGSCSTEEMAALTEEQQGEIVAELARMFPPGTAMSKQTHRYDVDGKLVESKLTMMGMEIRRQTFAYDEAGNKSEEVIYNEDGTLGSKTLFAREYDEHGNWTKELVSTASSWDAEFSLSTPAHVTRRIIKYW
jgi:YD repeat-containing protein